MFAINAAKFLLKSNICSQLDWSQSQKFTFGCHELHYQACRLHTHRSETEAGYGIDQNAETAHLKALMETIERYSTKKVSFQGAAAHFSAHLAEKNAYLEMIERDAWLRFLVEDREPQSIKDYMQFRCMRLPAMDSNVFVFAAFMRGFSCIPFGLAASYSQDHAEKKAFLELALSWVRHQAKDCAQQDSLYGKIHLRTKNPTFHKKIFFEKNKPSKSKTYSSERTKVTKPIMFMRHTHDRIYHWPISVITAHSNACLSWDLKLMEQQDCVAVG